jgi:hypothetical protein
MGVARQNTLRCMGAYFANIVALSGNQTECRLPDKHVVMEASIHGGFLDQIASV